MGKFIKAVEPKAIKKCMKYLMMFKILAMSKKQYQMKDKNNLLCTNLLLF